MDRESYLYDLCPTFMQLTPEYSDALSVIQDMIWIVENKSVFQLMIGTVDHLCGVHMPSNGPLFKPWPEKHFLSNIQITD